MKRTGTMARAFVMAVLILAISTTISVATSPWSSKQHVLQAQEQQEHASQMPAAKIAAELQNANEELCGLYTCISVEYESPTTAVLNGHYILFNSAGDVTNYNPTNTVLWHGVDALRSQGYSIASVTMGGEGSEGNPNLYHVILTKP